jgi:hypothetical protein
VKRDAAATALDVHAAGRTASGQRRRDEGGTTCRWPRLGRGRGKGQARCAGGARLLRTGPARRGNGLAARCGPRRQGEATPGNEEGRDEGLPGHSERTRWEREWERGERTGRAHLGGRTAARRGVAARAGCADRGLRRTAQQGGARTASRPRRAQQGGAIPSEVRAKKLDDGCGIDWFWKRRARLLHGKFAQAVGEDVQ